jgi:beta-lactamase class A
MRKKFFFVGGIVLITFSFLLFSSYSKLSLYNKRSKSFSHLKKEIENLHSQFEGEVSFLIKDLSFPNLSLSFKEHKKFPAASIIKLPLLAVALCAVNEGKVSFSRKITINRKDIFGGSGIIKTMALPVELSFKKILKLMITNSDNTATNKVIDILGFDYINNRFKRIGLKGTILKRKMMDFFQRKKGIENYTTASDIVLILEKVYNKQFINKEFSQFAMDALKEQKVNDRIPRYLPEGVNVAHKTGLEKGVVHDGGIVFTHEGDYIICVLTKGMSNYKEAKKFIAQISLLTYNLY